jgi:acyl-CoA dehydrogenase
MSARLLAEAGLCLPEGDDCLLAFAPYLPFADVAATASVRPADDGWVAEGEFPLAYGDRGARWVIGWASTPAGAPAVLALDLTDAAVQAKPTHGGRRVWFAGVRVPPERVAVVGTAGLARLYAGVCLDGAADCLEVVQRCVDAAYTTGEPADVWPEAAMAGQGSQFAVAEAAMDAYTIRTLVDEVAGRAEEMPAYLHGALAARLLAVPAAERALATAAQVLGGLPEDLSAAAARVARAAIHPLSVHQTRTVVGQEIHNGRLDYGPVARLPGELAELRALVRRLVTEVLLPHEPALNRDGDLPPPVWAELERRGRELGLSSLGVPAEHGGAGLGLLGQLVAAEEMGRVAVGFRHVVGTPAGAALVSRFGTDEQRDRYLTPWLAGERWGGWATTEPEAGSDLGAIRSTAVRTAAGWRIDGNKHFITGLDRADFVTTFVRTTPGRGVKGLTAFLVDLDTPGVSIGARQDMMGREGLHSYELRYDNVEVPDAQRLGGVDDGFRLLIRDVNRMRVLMAGHCLGVAARLIDIAVQWGRERVQFGRPIGEFGALQWYLADSVAELLACRAATYHLSSTVDSDRPAQARSATVKAYGTELAFRVADRVMQILGGTGYSKDMPVEALFRAVRLWRIAEGSSEIQRVLVSRQLAAGWRPNHADAQRDRGEPT